MDISIGRPFLMDRLRHAVRRAPVTAILGPRQCGKTTLARLCAAQAPRVSFFDLEDERDQARLSNPRQALEGESGLVIIDEVQRAPELFPFLRTAADRRPLPCHFLLLGSASPNLVHRSSESLAGRIEFIEMGGFSLDELGTGQQRTLWVRGAFPRAFLAKSPDDSRVWRENFIKTFLQQDLPQLGIRVPSEHMLRFWRMVAHLHGQTWNASEIGASLGWSHPTTRHYLDILTGAFMLRQLPPWFENLGKRIVKSPKIYVRDSGLLHGLLGLWSWEDVQGHPKFGFSWEGFAIEQILSRVGPGDAYFWATHGGAELDLLLIRGNKRWGFEFKAQDAPVMTKSMHVALNDLRLDHLWVVYPGDQSYRLDERVVVVGLGEALTLPQLKR